MLVSFHLQRHMGDFVIQVGGGMWGRIFKNTSSFCPQVYGPCILLVVISWVPFWLNREATSDRITLGRVNMVLLHGYGSNIVLMAIYFIYNNQKSCKFMLSMIQQKNASSLQRSLEIVSNKYVSRHHHCSDNDLPGLRSKKRPA